MGIGPISDDTLGYALKRQSPESISTLAYMPSLVFYHRQVRSHARGACVSFHDFAKRLGYGFLALPPDTS
jgi:hypothetical protein